MDAPYNLTAKYRPSDNTIFLEWGAPFSLDVTDEPDILYYTLCEFMSGFESGCRNISNTYSYPQVCNSSIARVSTSDEMLKLTLFAVNGYGNGANSTTFLSIKGTLTSQCNTCKFS